MKGSKILATIVAIAMVVSAMAIINVRDNIVKADRNTDYSEDGTHNSVVLSNDGTGGQYELLTCGELITLYVNNNSLTPDEDYGVQVWDGDSWETCVDIPSTDKADAYGDLAIQFHVPGFTELGTNPFTGDTAFNLGKGQWNISLFTEQSGGTQVWSSLNITINIGNLYDIYYTWNETDSINEAIDYITWGEQHTVYAHVRNWTGSTWEGDYGDINFIGDWRLTVSDPVGNVFESYDNLLVQNDYRKITANAWLSYYEYNYWINVSSEDNAAFYSNVTLPVKLNLDIDELPTNKEWGDSFYLNGEVSYNGTSYSNLVNYDLAVFAPTDAGDNGGWVQYKAETYPIENDGEYSIRIVTGPDEGYNAGTWYLGTYEVTPYMDVDSVAPYTANFVPYYSFEVGTNEDDLDVEVENTDDIITGFTQVVNVSVKNNSAFWSGSGDGAKEFQNMKIHVTGLDGWDQVNGIEYDDNDIVPIDGFFYRQANTNDENGGYSYYLFNYTFNETGTGTIIATWEYNWTHHTISSPSKKPGNDSYYSNSYNEKTALLPNIMGTATFSVVSADSMNLIIDDMVDSVSVTKTGNYWKNATGQTFLLQVFGSTSADPMNATISVSGCGLDFTIDETDPSDSDECVGYPGDGTYTAGQYYINIAPKIGGTLMITATNGTNSVSKDYAISGLTGTVTTSDGDDLKITVGSTETITLDTTTSYAPVHVSYYKSNWDQVKVLNYTDDPDGSAGEGEGGIYLFTPDVEDIGYTGYIVVAAEASAGNGLFMYDIIEVEPINDFEVEIVEPINDTNKLITAGLEYNLVVVKVYDSEGNLISDQDDPSVTIKLTDEDNDEDSPIQTWTMSEAGGQWELDDMRCWHEGTLIITCENATSGISHKGNLTVDVGLATITYNPEGATAGIGTEDLTVTVTGKDANGDLLPEGTDLYFWVKDGASEDDAVGGHAGNECAVNFKDADTDIDLDENGQAEFELDEVGDNQTSINATFVDGNPTLGNKTLGTFNIDFPVFEINPETIYIDRSNDISITAKDANGDAIEGLNLTLWGATLNGTGNQPDPVTTDSEGIVMFSITPDSSGIINVTIARNVRYVNGVLTWTNAIITDSYITITSIKTFQIQVSKSPITEGETLIVTVTDGANPVNEANVEFAGTTLPTGTDGKATFTAPDPLVESVTYYVTVSKSGFVTQDKGVTVVKKYELSISPPSGDVGTGEKFTITVIAKGSSLAGATVTFEGKTAISNGEGKATFTAPDTKGTYTVTASHDDYTEDATADITVVQAGTPGFELLTLIAAIGIAFILLRRRRRK